MAAIYIYWEDIKKESQMSILKALDDSGNYNVAPIAILVEEERNEESPSGESCWGYYMRNKE